jgi:hypothetical protein
VNEQTRNWLMRWKLEGGISVLPLRMLLTVPEDAFFDPVWDSYYNAYIADRKSEIKPQFYSEAGTHVIGVVQTYWHGERKASYSVFTATPYHFRCRDVPLAIARDAVREEAENLLDFADYWELGNRSTALK